jgi:ribulose 1,5-bisphosphate synthetase/thiazole synthase
MASVPVPPDEVNGTTTNGSVTAKEEYDAIIIGAGFSGISALHRLRKDGLKAHIFESGMLVYKSSTAVH